MSLQRLYLFEKILGYEKFSAVGWSMGGMTGALIAIDFPAKIEKLVVWGSHSRADEQSVKFGDSKFKMTS
jgi:pimeloyl-ACP methyl ester carboxylesterase